MKHKTGFFFSVIVFALAAVACSSSLLPAQTTPLPATSTLDGALAQSSPTPAATVTPASPKEPAGTDARLESIRVHLRRYRELSSQGKWAEAGKELEAIEAEARR